MATSKRRHGRKNENTEGRASEGRFSIKCMKSIFVKYVRPAAFVLAAVLCGFANVAHQSTMFENDRTFSHLSSLEREMTFRTEMGLYYSYFKVVVESNSFFDGLYQLMYDNRTEFPSTINTLQRFNVYPELIIGALYRIYISTTDYFSIQNKVCWIVNRGNGMSDIESCVGMGDPAIFYVNTVFLWNGLVSCVIFIFGYCLSQSVHGGILSAACFFFNHGECTRVQWTPPLRESFGYPIFLLQMLYVTRILSKNETTHSKLIITMLNVLYIFTWQFAQFSLLAQIFIIMIMFFLKIIRPLTAYTILHSHLLGLCISFCLLFGNTMLITSFYSAFLISALSVLHCHKFITKITVANLSYVTSAFSLLMQMLIMSFVFCVFKFSVKYVFVLKDDEHVLNILKSKVTNYQDFHTLLYTCAPEFDFLPMNTIYELCGTLILPMAAVVCCVVFFRYIQSLLTSKFQEFCKEYVAILYNVLQMLAFAAMALLVMRLKVFLTPHLCLISSLIASEAVFKFLKPNQHFALIILIISGMTIQGLENIKNQRNRIGEYSNPGLEEVMDWVENSTPKNAVFAGPMPTMANIMLSTRRAIVNHPHYENADLRSRTKVVYSLFSRQPEDTVWRNLKEMKVTHCVIGHSWCHINRRGCSLSSIWDKIQPELRHKEQLCKTLMFGSVYFTKEFENHEYYILKLK